MRLAKMWTLLWVGIVMIGVLDGYYDALGVFFMIWSNNVNSNLAEERMTNHY